MEFLLFILACHGLTQFLLYSSLLGRIRPKKGKLGELFSCSMCMGFHSGWIMFLLFWAGNLRMWSSIELGVVIMGFLSSSTSYILDKVVSDSGIQISKGGE